MFDFLKKHSIKIAVVAMNSLLVTTGAVAINHQQKEKKNQIAISNQESNPEINASTSDSVISEASVPVQPVSSPVPATPKPAPKPSASVPAPVVSKPTTATKPKISTPAPAPKVSAPAPAPAPAPTPSPTTKTKTS